ncbi:Uncharacterized protein APZ42_028475 [Daphnia magna]|uniref:Cuticular protein n=1 Tax=Daphnia magna TaxID=35525 RepID=A0A164QGZ0_9CRUS|nr:Uncharacterized protein APZ42_028475 [Daphnia magna]
MALITPKALEKMGEHKRVRSQSANSILHELILLTRTTMKSTIACLLVLAVAAQAQYFGNYGYGLGGYGGYYGGYYPYTGVRTAAVPAAYPVSYGYPSFTASQYHGQDELGQARFGYAHPGQAATNLRDAFGNQVGSYAYFNPDGKEVRVSYTADSRGFRVLSNDLPVAPVSNLVAPVQVQDTPEVAKAKAEHAVAVAAARAAAPAAPTTEVRLKRQSGAAHPFPAHVGVGQIGGAHPGPAHVGAGQIGGAHPGPAHVGANHRGGAHPCPAFVAC